MGKLLIALSHDLNGFETQTFHFSAGQATPPISGSQKPNLGQLPFFSGPRLNLLPLRDTQMQGIYVPNNVPESGTYDAHAAARIAP